MSTSRPDQAERAAAFVALHEARRGFIIPNPWDAGSARLLEALAYISTEIHKTFKPFFAESSETEKTTARETILKRLVYLADTMRGDFLLGPDISVADCYLFVMLLWAQKNGLSAPPELIALRDRMMERPAVRKAMTHEGLL